MYDYYNYYYFIDRNIKLQSENISTSVEKKTLSNSIIFKMTF